MQKVSFFDRLGARAAKVSAFAFWSKNPEYELENEIIKNSSSLREKLRENKIDILIAFSDGDDVLSPGMIKAALNEFTKLEVVIIGKDASYATVRSYFVNGVFDYLLEPVDEKKLEQTLLRMYGQQGEKYVVSNLKMKTDALIDNIFLGGGQEKFIIETIFEQIYRDWDNDPVDCQIVSDKAKTYIYETLVERKPWLEKFLYKKDYYHHFGFSLISKDDLVNIWTVNFRLASEMVKKYQMIDDKLVYKIGKYAVVHVDERLSLDDVSKGVFLNPTYISHIFKKVTGMSFVNFMTDVKIDRAKVLLRDSDARINEVAYTLGYSNQEYFTRTFKKKMKVTPVEYQKMLAEKYAFLNY